MYGQPVCNSGYENGSSREPSDPASMSNNVTGELPDGSRDASEEAPSTIEVWPVYNGGPVEADQFADFRSFQAKVGHGLKDLKRQEVRYDYVKVLVVYWRDTDVDQVGRMAERLAEVFRNGYDFDVKTHVLDNLEDSQPTIRRKFRTELEDTLKEVNDETNRANNLLILYYGGHGVDDGVNRLWKAKEKSTTSVVWSDLQSSLTENNCDIFYLFDCCQALAMVDTPTKIKEYQRRCEIFCSCGPLEKSSATIKNSFTTAVVDELSALADTSGIGVRNLYEMMTRSAEKLQREHQLKVTPRWRRFSNEAYRGTIAVARKGVDHPTPQIRESDDDSGIADIEARDDLTDARLLIKIHFTNPAERLLVEEWLLWFQNCPQNISKIDIAILKRMTCEGVFNTN